MSNYSANQAMSDTKQCYQSIQELKDAVVNSTHKQFMVAENDAVIVPAPNNVISSYIVSGKRSFEAASGYPGKKVAVLNFASNHRIGGKPFSSTTQEESLCHCSTLFPCLEAMKVPFYQKHDNDFKAGRLTDLGNDDLIYTPDVVVFKKDVSTTIPVMLPQGKWYRVNVITCAAPYLRKMDPPQNYENIITQRVKRILDVAAMEGNEVLILGAWGCGYYKNRADVVAHAFCSLLPNYCFETVEFGLATNNDVRSSVFFKEVEMLKVSRLPKIKKPDYKSFANIFGINPDPEEADAIQKATERYINNKNRFEGILETIGREGTDNLLLELKRNGFYRAPASAKHHNNCLNGLLYHSLDVYDYAMKFRGEMIQKEPALAKELPEDSVAIAALLHDVCKADEYKDVDGKAVKVQSEFPLGGHGDKSVIKILMWGYPLKPEEILAIKWHMGEKRLTEQEDIINCQKAKELALCRLIIKADYEASHMQKE